MYYIFTCGNEPFMKKNALLNHLKSLQERFSRNLANIAFSVAEMEEAVTFWIYNNNFAYMRAF